MLTEIWVLYLITAALFIAVTIGVIIFDNGNEPMLTAIDKRHENRKK